MRAIPLFVLLLSCRTSDKGVPTDSAPTDSTPGSGSTDADADGFTTDNDCDDEDAAINPAADEVCDGVDNDCDGLTDDEDTAVVGQSTWYTDGDGDGYGVDGSTVSACDQPSGAAAVDGDCDDTDPAYHPGADESDCSANADYNCDGSVSYDDVDGDGYAACEECDDANASTYPGAEEVCDGEDNDCDGEIDEDVEDAYTWYNDGDGDGYGNPDVEPVESCDRPEDGVRNKKDCDDEDADVNPDAEEVWYDGVDSDCDGWSDYDKDLDGYDSSYYGGDDCRDWLEDVHPGADEIWYDGVDQDCDEGSDYDADGDGYDSATYGGSDCDDHDADVYPGAPETDDAKDNDCDGDVESMPEAVASHDADDDLATCSPLHLDGSGSSDPDGDDLTYAWELVSAPSTSTLTTSDIQEPDDESPVFYPDAAGDYTFSLTVTDEGDAESYPSTITVTIVDRDFNTPPDAELGSDETVESDAVCWPVSYGETYECHDCDDETVTLDASGSTDADGDELTYSWEITSGDEYGTLSDTEGESVSLTLSGATATYEETTDVSVTVQVTVRDCAGDTAIDSVVVNWSCTGS